MHIPKRLLENYNWLNGYTSSNFSGDFISALILSVLLVPQSLAYALLAGLPPQAGIYAAIFPAIAYAVFGSSRYLSVGPVAITSIMTAAAIAHFPEEMRMASAAILALIAGGFLVLFGLLKGGALATFFSRPVVSAYITGASILIILSQAKHLFQIDVTGRKIVELLPSIITHLKSTHVMTLLIGTGTILALVIFKQFAVAWLTRLGIKSGRAALVAKLSPIVIVSAAVILTTIFKLDSQYGVSVIGKIPKTLPHLVFPVSDIEHWKSLVLSGFLIALVGFVDSISVGQTLAAKSRLRVDPNKELLGVGAANIAGGLTGAYPVAGSLSRSAINYSSGARSPLVGIMAAIIMAIAVMTIMPLLSKLPLATLAGLIIFSCLSLLNFSEIWRVWRYSKSDALTAVGAFFAVLFLGVQYGVLAGTVLSMIIHIRLTLKPHTVEAGRFPGTEHYRDASRFEVEEFDELKTLRIDESLYFANARFLEDTVMKLVVKYPKMKDLVLMCPAVNRIDASALDSLLEINERLDSLNIRLHLSELHVIVRERLHRSNFMEKLTGEIFLSQHEAIETLRPEPDWSQFSDHIDIH